MSDDSPAQAGADIRIGTSGWSFPDWHGVVYPRTAGPGFSTLGFVAGFLDAVEINNTFYRPPAPDHCRKWLRQVGRKPDFRFTLKLWQRFTHELEQPWTDADVDTFMSGIGPLVESGRLGTVLVQFPWSFERTQQNTDHILRIADAFGALSLTVEVRHVSWQAEDFFDLLRKRRLNFCNIDQPATRRSLQGTNLATADTAYYRLHGRNREMWFDRSAGRDERYDYLYAEDELRPWVERIREISERTQHVYVMANNHTRGQAFANALQLKALLTGARVRAPRTLLRAYPILSRVADAESDTGQLTFVD